MAKVMERFLKVTVGSTAAVDNLYRELGYNLLKSDYVILGALFLHMMVCRLRCAFIDSFLLL